MYIAQERGGGDGLGIEEYEGRRTWRIYHQVSPRVEGLHPCRVESHFKEKKHDNPSMSSLNPAPSQPWIHHGGLTDRLDPSHIPTAPFSRRRLLPLQIKHEHLNVIKKDYLSMFSKFNCVLFWVSKQNTLDVP